MVATQTEAQGHPAFAALPVATPPADNTPEYVVYLALKLDACERRLRGQSRRVPITARWFRALLDRLARDGDSPLELEDLTSHFLRERLRALNHGTALQAVPSERSLQYAWTEVLAEPTLRSYATLRGLLHGRPFLAIDLARIEAVFGDEPFRQEAYLDEFRRLLQLRIHRRWYSLASSLDPEAPAYTTLLRRRLEELLRLGLVEARGSQLRLSVRALEACHWFHLVVHSVSYPPNGAPAPGLHRRA